MKPHLKTHVLMVILWWAAGLDVAAQQLANRRGSLAGHSSVFVSVSTPEARDVVRDLGLVQASLERYVLQRLEQSQIPASAVFRDQTLILEIRVDVHRVIQTDGVNVYAFVSQFDALQAARLAANRQSALVATWRATQFGAVTREEAALLRDSVVNNLDRFMTDYQAAQSTPR